MQRPLRQLNFEAVKEWAKSLSLKDHAQWLNNLSERKGKRSKEPFAKEEAQALKLQQEKQEQEAHALKLKQDKLEQEERALAQALKKVLAGGPR
jgi:hypothetical protein